MKNQLLILLLFIFNFSFPDSSNIYKQIQNTNISSLAWQEEEWPNNDSFQEYVERCFEYQLNLQKIKKRRAVYKIFDSHSNPQEHNCLFDMATIQDLNLLAGKKEGESYGAEIVDRTKTEFGKVFLYGLICSPVHDILVLQSRQNIIKYLLEHPDTFAQLDAVYTRFAQSQNMFISLWAQDGFINLSQRRYFKVPFAQRLSDILNHSTIALQSKSVWEHQMRVLYVASGIAAAIILPAYGISQLCNRADFLKLNTAAHYLQGAGGRLLSILSSADNQLIAGASTIAAGISCMFLCKEELEWTRDNFILDLCLQRKMALITQFLSALLDLQEILHADPEFVKICPAAQAILDFMQAHAGNAKMQKLLDLCDSSTFKGQASILSLQGRVLAAFKLIYDLKETLEPLLLHLGELDAYCSCARLYTEFKDKKVTFCFTEFIQEANPCIAFTNFWNPFINPEKVITNSIALHGPERRNMVITGPNAGGKSTLIKGIPFNLILSQSIGMAAATSAHITPFYAIATYLNIVDDIASGNSLFKAQVLRAQEMVNLVKTIPANHFSFIALDEMFNGTSAKESMVAAYSVVKHIEQYHNNISVIATHFPLLTKLENECKSFENYKVSVQVTPAGIKYPFILEKGVSNQHIALDILQHEGYDSSIIADAMALLEQAATI